MRALIIIIFTLSSIQLFAQDEAEVEPKFIFTPLKMSFGHKFGDFEKWNKQLDQFGYSTIDLNSDEAFEFSLYLKNHVVLKTWIGVSKESDSTYINDRMIDYKRRFYGVNVGYNLFSLNKIWTTLIVPSIGVYTGRDRILCKSRVPLNNYSYKVKSEYLYRYESGLNANLYISLNPFKESILAAFFGVGVDVGAYYNFNTIQSQQYKNALDGSAIARDKPFTPYIRFSLEPYRGLFGYARPKRNKSPKEVKSI